MLDAISRVCTVYSVRNAHIGYSQGFNFIVARLLQIMTEEEVFWTFTCIVERLMPIDYFQQMVGARVDQQIMEQLIAEKFPRLAAHFQECFYQPSMTTLQWFTCLFAYNFNFEVLQRLWDLIFLKGNKIMFRIALAIFHLLEQPLLKCDQISEILACMDTISSLLQDPNIVLQIANMPRYKITQS